jgi:hypothetical protein
VPFSLAAGQSLSFAPGGVASSSDAILADYPQYNHLVNKIIGPADKIERNHRSNKKLQFLLFY